MPYDNRPLGLQDSNYHVDQNTYSDEAFQGEYSGTNLIYKGFAKPGASVDEPVWQIAFLTYDMSNNVLMIQWPMAPVINGTSVPRTENLGTVTTPWTMFAGSITNLPIVKGSVEITVGAVTYTDELMNGTLSSTGSNTGTIDYDTGAIALTIDPALAMDTDVIATYSTYPLGAASNDYQFVWSERHSYTYV